MKVMLLAAGEGTRFRPHTLKLPKPAIPFLNVPLAYHQLRLMDELQPEGFVVNTFHLASEIHKVFKKIQFRLKDLQFSDEKEKILGSAGGLGFAANHFKKTNTILLSNGDEVFFPYEEQTLLRALQHHESEKALATLVVMDHPGVQSGEFGGIWVDADDKVLGFGKTKPEGAVAGYHYIGFCFLNHKVFGMIPAGESNILHDVLKKDLQSVRIFKTNGMWFETGNLTSYLEATEEALKLLCKSVDATKDAARAQRYLLETLKEFSPDSELYKLNTGNLLISKKSSSIPDTSISGFAVVGAGVEAPRSVRLNRSVVGGGVRLDDFESLDLELRL